MLDAVLPALRRVRPLLDERLLIRVLWTYCLAIVIMRMAPSFMPTVAETDWKQWVWQYHRYHTDGAFPPGHILTDYAMVVQPPVFWAAMAGLSSLLPPVFAAITINVIAFVLSLVCMAKAVAARTTPLFGAIAAALLARDDLFHRITCGGYPRSFGPALTLLFLAAWLSGRHRLVLGVFVLGAGLYPSVVVPCALAYGAWSVLLAGRAGWWRRNLELVACGVVVAGLAQLQNFLAPEWWGSVVTAAEAADMPQLGPEGRFTWLPLGAFWPKVWSFVVQPFTFRGVVASAGWFPYPKSVPRVAYVLVCAVAALAAVVIPIVRRRRGDATARITLPLHPFLLLATCVLSYWLARELAFKLYLPHRMVQHTVPFVMTVAFVISVVTAAQLVVKDAVRAKVAAALVCLSVFLVSGEGFSAPALRSYAKDEPLYAWIDANTPIGAQFAGNYQILDEIPFFAKRQVYVNWKMAHPVRKGFFDVIESRTLAMYDAYYATDVATVLRFADEAKIDYFVVDRTRFAKVEKGDGQLFEPLRTKVVTMWEARDHDAFVLNPAPAEAIVFQHRVYDVIDVAKLRALKP